MKRTKTRKKVLPSLGQNLSEDGVDIKKELQELNDRSDLNKDNVIEMMSKILSVMNSPDVNYQHHNVIDLGLHGCTLLHIAARFDYYRIAGLLIEAGAKVDSKDMLGCTPLHYAAMNGDNIEVAKVLIANGANVNEQDIYRRRPLYYALDNGYREVAKFLISKGAQINNKEVLQALNDRPDLNKGNVIKMMQKYIPHLVKDSPDVNYSHHKIMYYGSFKPIFIHCTLLHMAAEYNCPRLAGYLIEIGADVNLKDARDRTPLQVAFENDDLETATLLIANGADRACVPAYITKRSHSEGEIIAIITVILAATVTAIVLADKTELSALAITGATIASMLIVSVIAYGLAYMWSKYTLNSMLNQVKCDNSLSPQPTK